MIDVSIHTHEHMADLKITTLYFKDSSPKEYVLWTSLYDIVEKTKPVYRGDETFLWPHRSWSMQVAHRHSCKQNIDIYKIK